jgi:hypothetical protein
VLVDILAQLHDGRQTLLTYLKNMNNDPDISLPSNMLFFLSEDGRPIDFTLEGMKTYMSSIGFSSDLADNFPRHFHRTYTFNSGVQDDAAAAQIGHQRNGREFLSLASSTLPAEAAKSILAVLESMMREIGYERLPYIR